jgi:hypothetical protein
VDARNAPEMVVNVLIVPFNNNSLF